MKIRFLLKIFPVVTILSFNDQAVGMEDNNFKNNGFYNIFDNDDIDWNQNFFSKTSESEEEEKQYNPERNEIEGNEQQNYCNNLFDYILRNNLSEDSQNNERQNDFNHIKTKIEYKQFSSNTINDGNDITQMFYKFSKPENSRFFSVPNNIITIQDNKAEISNNKYKTKNRNDNQEEAKLNINNNIETENENNINSKPNEKLQLNLNAKSYVSKNTEEFYKQFKLQKNNMKNTKETSSNNQKNYNIEEQKVEEQKVNENNIAKEKKQGNINNTLKDYNNNYNLRTKQINTYANKHNIKYANKHNIKYNYNYKKDYYNRGSYYNNDDNRMNYNNHRNYYNNYNGTNYNNRKKYYYKKNNYNDYYNGDTNKDNNNYNVSKKEDNEKIPTMKDFLDLPGSIYKPANNLTELLNQHKKETTLRQIQTYQKKQEKINQAQLEKEQSEIEQNKIAKCLKKQKTEQISKQKNNKQNTIQKEMGKKEYKIEESKGIKNENKLAQLLDSIVREKEIKKQITKKTKQKIELENTLNTKNNKKQEYLNNIYGIKNEITSIKKQQCMIKLEITNLETQIVNLNNQIEKCNDKEKSLDMKTFTKLHKLLEPNKINEEKQCLASNRKKLKKQYRNLVNQRTELQNTLLVNNEKITNLTQERELLQEKYNRIIRELEKSNMKHKEIKRIVQELKNKLK